MPTNEDDLLAGIAAGVIPATTKLSALKAIKTVVFGAADYAGAWIERATQGVRDGTEARTVLSRALAGAGAKAVLEDEALVERAIAAWMPRAIAQQRNREAIAREAVDQLASTPQIDSDALVGDEWLSRFSTFAADISTEELQKIWGLILAREISQPGRVSMRTLRVLSEIDVETAKIFERYAKYVFNNTCLIYKEQFKKEPIYDDMLVLADVGIIHTPIANVTDEFDIYVGELFRIGLCGGYLECVASVDGRISLPIIPLTRAGADLAAIMINEELNELGQDLTDRISQKVLRVDLYQGGDDNSKFLKTLLIDASAQESVAPTSEA